jgi:hypothetical protein
MPLGTAVLTAVKSLLSKPGLGATTLTPTTRTAAITMRTMDSIWRMLTVQLVQPALKVAQDVNLVAVEVFKPEELGEVKLSILKKGNDNACIECRDGHAHYSTRIIQLQTTAGNTLLCPPLPPARHLPTGVLSWSAE